MVVLFYTDQENPYRGRFIEMIGTLTPALKKECYCCFEGLAGRLNKPKDEDTFVVIMTTDDEELIDVVNNRELLWNTRLILLLHSRDEIMVSLAHRLYPRYLGYSDQNVDDVAAVLMKIAGLCHPVDDN